MENINDDKTANIILSIHVYIHLYIYLKMYVY